MEIKRQWPDHCFFIQNFFAQIFNIFVQNIDIYAKDFLRYCVGEIFLCSLNIWIK